MTGPAPSARYVAAAAPILAELGAAGYELTEIRQLRHLGVRYEAAVPILIRWLPVATHDAVYDDIVELVRDRTYGRDREMLAPALGRMSDPRAVDVLLELAADAEVSGHAAIVLGRLRTPRAAPVLRELTRSPRRWVRREAAKALKRLAG